MNDDQARFALAMRMGRAALGMNQQDFADLLGLAKSTVARNETLDISMRAETLTNMIRLLRERGVEVDLFSDDQCISVKVNTSAAHSLREKMQDDSQRRSDRKRH